MSLKPEALEHYNMGMEDDRLKSGSGLVEYLRTLEIIRRHLGGGSKRILDAGGGTGPYAIQLASEGHSVSLLDAAPIHIETLSKNPQSSLLQSFEVGDARSLGFANDTFDVILLLGPLYHLTEFGDRKRTLSEAWRVLRPGGVVIGAAITKFASLLHGYMANLIEDPVFKGIVAGDLRDGQHRNPTNHPRYFTTTKFHEPNEFRSEFVDAQFEDVEILAVESFSWMLSNLEDHLSRDTEELLAHLRRIESEPSIQGVSSHILAVGRRPG